MTSAGNDPVPSAPAWGWVLLYGIVCVILGLLAFAWPFSATFAAIFVIGCFVAASGIAALVASIFAPGIDGRLYMILFGLLSLIVGALLLLRPAAGAISLTLLVEIWLMARGVLEIILGIRFRRHRWAMIALGVLNVLLALFILFTLPAAALTLPGFILGLSFLWSGVVAMMQAFAIKAVRAGPSGAG